ncbi:hypothetical protein HLB25_05815 [Dickeya dadantii]|uniref:hypothetical protein n=1 Tax=Dickeya dadantii TaxID=204038 RepID=UPI00137319EC|nr:hypothetical protein [Dickeya dadantii]NAT78905.1 hypothetical protein [Dickeya dadantii]NPE54749.1 hypothetical protein [Dickeya dadantii]NPE61761.1 hypothetical protein [Dickeya dadantii]NPE66330.1 hypothetical protein [Dickeya dadantii]
MRHITVMALGLLALIQCAWADVYRGTIGNANVVLELKLGDGPTTGRFFDVQDHKDRSLTAWIEGMDDESLMIVPDSQLGSSISDGELNKRHHMVLRPNKEKQRWQGEWRQPNGQRLPVNLTLISGTDIPNDNAQAMKQGLRDVSLYDYLLWQTRPVEFLGERDMGEYRLAWWQNPQTRVKIFQFVSGYPPETMAALNRTLQQEWWSTMLKQQVCVDNGGYLSQQIQITLLSASLVSYINQIYHRDCKVMVRYEDDAPGQGSGDSNEQKFWLKPQTLSTRTAKPVALSQLLSIGENKEADEYPSPSFDSALPKWLYEQLMILHRDELAARSDTYPAPEPDGWVQVGKNWFATAKGLRFYSNISTDDHIGKITYDSWALLPWSFIKSHSAENVRNGELVLP